MKKRFLKLSIPLLVCLSLLFAVSNTTAFAKAAGEDTHNYQLRSGVYMGFDFLSYDAYDFIGKFTVDPTNFTGFDVKKFTVSSTLHGETTDLGVYPSSGSWDIRINGRTNYKDVLRFAVTLYDQDNHTYVVESSFDLRQFEDSGIFVSDYNQYNQEIFVNFGSYYHGYVTYTFNGYTYDSGGRSGGSGAFPVTIGTPAPGFILEVKIVLDGTCELIRTYQF